MWKLLKQKSNLQILYWYALKLRANLLSGIYAKKDDGSMDDGSMAMHSGKNWRNALWLNAMHSGKN